MNSFKQFYDQMTNGQWPIIYLKIDLTNIFFEHSETHSKSITVNALKYRHSLK
jgi:hypothetical protein